MKLGSERSAVIVYQGLTFCVFYLLELGSQGPSSFSAQGEFHWPQISGYNQFHQLKPNSELDFTSQVFSLRLRWKESS